MLELPRQARCASQDRCGLDHQPRQHPHHLRQLPQGHSSRVAGQRARRVVEDCQRRQEDHRSAGVLDLPRGACDQGSQRRHHAPPDVRWLRQLPRQGDCLVPGQFPRQGDVAEQRQGRGLCRLPHAAPQPAGVRSALEHPPGQPGQDLRRVPRQRECVVPDLRSARQPDGPETQFLRLPDLARHDGPAARRVRLLRPARPAVAAARPRRQAARRVRRRASQDRAARAPLQQHADGHARDHRDELPAAGRHRAAAEVRRGPVGTRPDDAARRPADGRRAAPPRRDRDLRLLRLAPRRPGLRLGGRTSSAASSGARARWCRSRATCSTCGP